MSEFLKRQATPFVTGLFLVSLISGVALFFHWGQSYFRGMHEWLSMVLIVPFVLHVWKNWRAMLAYMGQAPFTIAMVVSLVASLAFAWPALTGASGGSGRGGPPPLALMHAVLAKTPAEIAPIIGTTPEALVEGLKAKGFAAAAPDVALSEIGKQAGKGDMELTAAMMAAGK